jgi:hypothetical protein
MAISLKCFVHNRSPRGNPRDLSRSLADPGGKYRRRNQYGGIINNNSKKSPTIRKFVDSSITSRDVLDATAIISTRKRTTTVRNKIEMIGMPTDQSGE